MPSRDPLPAETGTKRRELELFADAIDIVLDARIKTHHVGVPHSICASGRPHHAANRVYAV